MEIIGSYTISADKQTVWEALNNPEILRVCIPGCETLEQTSDTSFDATASVKVGPVKAKFKGSVELQDLDPPHAYTIVGSGKGGIAGFASGEARVQLSEADEGTQLDYTVDAKVGGKLAQIGGRLIQGTAKKLADEFFEGFKSKIEGPDEAGTDGETQEGDAG